MEFHFFRENFKVKKFLEERDSLLRFQTLLFQVSSVFLILIEGFPFTFLSG